jgi:hypothetical protein
MLRCWKALAAWAKYRAIVALGLSIAFVPGGCHAPRLHKRKKTDVAKHAEVFDHVGLLVNGLPGTAELTFI